MDKKEQILQLVPEQGILPLYFHKDITVSVDVMKALYAAGVKAMEYTNRGEAALFNFGKLVEVRNAELPEMQLGIGTIKNAEQAKDFIAAGADYLISPGFVNEVANEANDAGLLYVPGCMTPSEIIAAENAGCKFIKLFPGNLLGPEFMSTIKELFANLLFMPTGGVDTTAESIGGWFKAGVCAVGMGSKLVSKDLMEKKDYAAITSKTKEVMEIVKAIKNK